MKFKKGQSPNPKGRPKGSKNKFTRFAEDLFTAWQEVGGIEKLKKYMTKNDRNYGRVIEIMGRLMPRELKLSGELDAEITVKDYSGMSKDELLREFDQKAKATGLVLSRSGISSN